MNLDYVQHYRNIGRKVQFYRQRQGMNQLALGVLMDTDQAYISRIERGSQGVSLDQLFRIAEVLGVEPYMLLYTDKPLTDG